MRVWVVLLCLPLWAKNPCPDLSQRELARVKLAQGQLFACGSRRGMVRDLNVYLEHPDQGRERLFDGDAQIKSYRWHRVPDGFDIEEAVGFGSFRPFIALHVGCSAARCQAIDSKCVWKKRRPNPHVVAQIQALNGNVPDPLWTSAFYAALNGSAAARRLFEGNGLKNPGDAEHSERFSTHRADLARLQTLGCLR